MRNFFHLSALLAWSIAASAAAPTDDLSSVALVPAAAYDPRSEQGRGFKQFFSGIGVSMAGPSTDLGATIAEKLALPELAPYFPDAKERERLARKIGDDVKGRYLSKGYSNDSVNAAMKSATDQLVALVVPRVLATEGVKDAARGRAWAAKISAPFDRCMRNSISYLEGKKCGEALESSLVENVGLAMSYELSRQEFGPSYATARPQAYGACLNAARAGAEARVRGCAVAGVRQAALAFGRARVLEEASKQMPAAAAAKLTNDSLAPFSACLLAVSARSGFLRCADNLVENAGGLIAEQAVRTDPRVGSYFPSPGDRDQLASAGRAAFGNCMKENERKNLRDISGTLVTDNCESFVELETARTVAGEVFRSTIEKNLPDAPPAQRAAALQAAKAQLAQCWDSRTTQTANGACLRTVAKQTALDVAGRRISAELPADLNDPTIRPKILVGFADCLESNLPADLLHSASPAAVVASCANDTERGAALAVAESKMRAALKGKLDDTATLDDLVKKSVGGEFASCLGAPPIDTRLPGCTLSLQKTVAYDSAAALMPRKLDEFFRGGGGAAAYGVSPAQRQKMLDEALAGHERCLEANATSLDPTTGMNEINACFKETVRGLVLELGTLELGRQAKANNLDVTAPAFRQTTIDLAANMATCLDRKRDDRFTLDDYLDGLNACQTQATKTLTTQLARRELASNLRQVLGEQAGPLEDKLTGELNACMDKAEDSAGSSACVDALRSSATVALAKAGVHARASKELGTTLPTEITSLDATLDACMLAKAKSADECALDYVKDSTKTIGHLAVASQLSRQLGASRVAKLAPDIKAKLEGPFGKCVDAVKLPLAPKLLDDLDSCGSRLAQNGLDYLMHHKTDWALESVLSFFRKKPPAPAATPAAEVGQEEITGMYARTILCVQGGSGNLDSLRNLDPGSTEAKLVQLLGAYVSYDVKAARNNLDALLTQVGYELKAAGPAAARTRLLGLLTSQGAVDQLVKGLLKSELQKSLVGKGIPARVTAQLTDSAFLDKALTEEQLSDLRAKMTVAVLQPTLVDGAPLTSPAVTRGLRAVRADSLEDLLSSPFLDATDIEKDHVREALKL